MHWRMMMVMLGGALLMGCAVGPNFRPPKAPDTQTYTSRALPSETATAAVAGGTVQRFKMGEKIPDQWWKLFHSEALDRLIRRALVDNPTTAAAQAALRQAQELLRAQYGATWFPGVDANLSASRQRFGGASFGQASGGGSTFELYNASVNVSYLLDIFGGARRELESLQAQVDYQHFQLLGTYLTLTANIVTSAMQEASLRAQLQATKEILADQQHAYELVQRQFQLGGISRADVLTQQTQLAQTRATLPPLEKALSQTRHLLAVLVGKLPNDAGTLPEFDIHNITLPKKLPVSLPSSLVRQRPDIQAAEALLHAASAQVGVATANLYPRITLTGSYGSETNKIGDLFNSDTVVWNFGAGLLQPLFHGGELKAKRRAAVAAYDQALALYRQTVLRAFLNVADVLRALESDARTLKAQFEAEKAAKDTLALTKKQFQFGAVSYLLLLAAQRQYQTVRISLIQAQAARFADTAALFQAVGTGQWHAASASENRTARPKG
ncbi:MAG: efflux transporter outer membrane subunit [Desulfobacterales bacterium]|nr:efflux transporter outer membrane subunit [Desulfobacterales bacterium]